MAFGGVHPFMLKSGGGGGGSTGVVWDVLKWRCRKGKPSWDEGNTRFLGISGEVNHTIANGYGTSTHYAEFLVSYDDELTGPGVVNPNWFTGTCSSDSAGATPLDSLDSYMTDMAYGTWVTGPDIKTPFDDVTISWLPPMRMMSNRVGIEVDVPNNEVSFYEVIGAGPSVGSRTLLDTVDYDSHGVDFDDAGSGTPKASFAATSYLYDRSVRIFSESDDWLGTPSPGYGQMNS